MTTDVEGDWVASTYSTKGQRTDHALVLSGNGSFSWSRTSPGGSDHRIAGTWEYNPAEELINLQHMDADGQPAVSLWAIQHVSGFEESNAILVLRWLAIATLNLPILFTRIHPKVGSGEKT